MTLNRYSIFTKNIFNVKKETYMFLTLFFFMLSITIFIYSKETVYRHYDVLIIYKDN